MMVSLSTNKHDMIDTYIFSGDLDLQTRFYEVLEGEKCWKIIAKEFS